MTLAFVVKTVPGVGLIALVGLVLGFIWMGLCDLHERESLKLPRPNVGMQFWAWCYCRVERHGRKTHGRFPRPQRKP